MARHTKAQKARAATRLMPEEDPEFQIAPMIDILLVLLVFFMSIATDQVLQVSKEVTLPVAKDAKQVTDRENEIIVNVVWNEIANKGAIKINDAEVDPQKLQDMITARKNANPEIRVVIRGDEKVKYEYIRSVMVIIGAAKVPNVIFSAVDKEMQK